LLVNVIATVVLPLKPGLAATETTSSLTVTALTPVPLNEISVFPVPVKAVVCDNFVFATDIGVWFVLPAGTDPVAAGVDPEFPGVVAVAEPDDPVVPEAAGVDPVAEGVDPEFPGVVVDDPVEPALPEAAGVDPVAEGVDPEFPGVVVDDPVEPALPEAVGVEPDAAGVDPVAAGVDPVAAGVNPEFPGAGETITTVAFTGVVATVTKVTTAAFFAAAGVDPDFPGAAAAETPPPEFPFDDEAFAVH
jgi:hypothetical protein